MPELEPLAELGYRMVLDGELIAFDRLGRLDFYALSQRMTSKRPTRAVTLCIFDVMWLNGNDVSQLPYRERRKLLDMLELSGPTWCTVPSFAAEGSRKSASCGRSHIKSIGNRAE